MLKSRVAATSSGCEVSQVSPCLWYIHPREHASKDNDRHGFLGWEKVRRIKGELAWCLAFSVCLKTNCQWE